MTKIDWNKPIETVPCQRNPVPVPCEFAGFDDEGDAKVFIRDDWFSGEDINYRDPDDRIFPWLAYAANGQIQMGGFSIYLRNVADAEDADDAAEARIRDAAPEMLQALLEARAELEAFAAEFVGENYNNLTINAAIAKAKGEQA